jgi:hypothetical protein
MYTMLMKFKIRNFYIGLHKMHNFFYIKCIYMYSFCVLYIYIYRVRQANFLFIWVYSYKKEVSLPHPVLYVSNATGCTPQR